MSIADTLFQRQQVPLPGHQGLWVRMLSAGEMFEALELDGYRQQVAIVDASIVDENGELVFGPQRSSADIPSRVFLGLLKAANDLNSIGDDVIEEAEGN